MNLNNKKNIAIIISVIFLLLAIFHNWSYGFFNLLRLVVFASTSYVAWIAYKTKHENWVWIWIFIALIFNPFFPLHFGRDLWIVIDFIITILLLGSIFIFKVNENLK